MPKYDALIQRGLGLQAQGRYSEAESQFLAVLDRSTRADSATRECAMYAEWNLCELFLSPGNVDLTKAAQHAAAMLEVAGATVTHNMVATAQRELGLIAMRRGAWVEAVQWCDSALRHLSSDANEERASCHGMIGIAQRRMGDAVSARDNLEEALALCRLAGYLFGKADVLLQLAELDDEEDEDLRAYDRAQDAVARFQAGATSFLSDSPSLRGQARCKQVLAHLCYKHGDHVRGHAFVDEAVDLFEHAGEREVADSLRASERQWLQRNDEETADRLTLICV